MGSAPDSSSSSAQQQTVDAAAAQHNAQSRVCDTCRIRKCKCSNERPTCESCRDNGWTCTYSLKRKRPGPVPGSKRKRQPGTSTLNGDDLKTLSRQSPVSLDSGRSDNAVPLLASKDAVVGGGGGIFKRGPDGMIELPRIHEDIGIVNDGSVTWFNQHLRQLIGVYFEHISPGYPFLDEHDFEGGYRLDETPRFLLYSMAALSVRFMPRNEVRFVDSKAQVDMAVDLARQAHRELDRRRESNLPTTIVDVQATVLLTIFEYSRRPGRRAWEQTNRLARMAYSVGLNAIDDEIPQRMNGANSLHNPSERDLRRHLWWAVWRLDSYAGIVTGSPFNISRNDVSTNLPGRPQGVGNNRITGNVVDIWKSLFLREEPHACHTLRNMFIIANSLVREASAVSRFLRSGKSYSKMLDYIHYNWHHIRQSTPTWFWNPKFDGLFETPETHRLRVEVLLQFQILTVQACFPPLSLIPREKKVERCDMDAGTRWQAIVAGAEDMIAILRHWKRSYYSRVEPFACFVPWTAAVVCKLEQCRLGDDDSTATALFVSYVGVMEVALAEFTRSWELPNQLSDSLQTVKALNSRDIPAEVLVRIMAGCFGPLGARQSVVPGADQRKPSTEYLPHINHGGGGGGGGNAQARQEIYGPVDETQFLRLPDEITNFTFHSPFLDGLLDDWNMTLS